MDQNILGKRFEGIVIKGTDHAEEQKLPKVKESTSRMGGSQEEDCTVGVRSCSFMR